MKKLFIKRFSLVEMAGVITVMVLSLAIYSHAVTVPNQFVANTTASADEVNANFQALVDAVSTLEAEVAALQSNSVLALDGILTLDSSSGYETALFSGVNLQVNNGAAQDSLNGLGNVIVGFNNVPRAGFEVCSDGQYDNQLDCEGNSEIWARWHQTGSHNLVVGDGNSFSSYGSVVFGSNNVSNRVYGNVTGGRDNIASGPYSSVAGGVYNTASNFSSSVNGGQGNIASGLYASINGGQTNIASGTSSSVSGGQFNTASGGISSVTGGIVNTASGDISTVSGGQGRSAVGADDWVAGTLFEDF
ncbi:MAG TPA: hypothetical protein VIU33_00230 [Nitrospiria bacterium]